VAGTGMAVPPTAGLAEAGLPLLAGQTHLPGGSGIARQVDSVPGSSSTSRQWHRPPISDGSAAWRPPIARSIRCCRVCT